MAASGVVVPQPMPWHRRLVAVLVSALFWFGLKTWRVRWVDSSHCFDSKGPVIFCVWHNRLATTLASYNEFVKTRWPAKGMAAMISASRDGSLISNIVERFGIQPIRGSTSRRGPQALLEATTWLERDYNIVITPDGPRGPVYNIQEGIIKLAQLTGRPIVPTCNFARWRVNMPSWDRFQVPLPFALCQAFFDAPIWVPRDATEDEREQLRAKLELAMRGLTKD